MDFKPIVDDRQAAVDVKRKKGQTKAELKNARHAARSQAKAENVFINIENSKLKSIKSIGTVVGHMANGVEVISSFEDAAKGEVSYGVAATEAASNYVPVVSQMQDVVGIGLTTATAVTGGAAPKDAYKRAFRATFDANARDKYADEGLNYLERQGVPSKCLTDYESCGLTWGESVFMGTMSGFGAKEW